MKKYAYDLIELSKSGEIDVNGTIEYFGSEKAYFKMLTDFSIKSPKYMQFTPIVITYSDDAKNDFLSETERLKKAFLNLGMKKTVSILDDMSAAAENGDTKVLSDKLVQFKAKLEMINKDIETARREIEEPPTVLAVDDMPEILTTIKSMLDEDYKVIAVTSVKSGMKVVDLHVPDIFLLDIEMPEEDGYEMARQIRGKDVFAETPILFLTGRSKKEDVLEAMKHGGVDYILKPVNRDILVSRIKRGLLTGFK